MKYVTEDQIRDWVAKFILESANDSDCLTECIGELLPEDLEENEWYAEDSAMSELAYQMFDRAEVSVVVDGVEYNG